MVGKEAEGDPVEETPALGRPLHPEPIHGGGEPEQAGDPGEGGLGRGLAVDLDQAARPLGAADDEMGAIGGLDLGRELPADPLGRPGEVLGRRAAEAAAGREQGQGLEKVGLARAVRPVDRHRPPSNRRSVPRCERKCESARRETRSRLVMRTGVARVRQSLSI